MLCQPGEGPVYVSLGQENTIKVSAGATGSTLCAVEIMVPPGSGTPPHIHTLEDETFYVLEGTMRFNVAGQQIDAGVGTTLFAPRNGVHNFENVTDQNARMLCICTPGANMETFFAELGAVPLGQQPDEVVALCAKHGIQLPQISATQA